MTNTTPSRTRKTSEDGYMLLAAIFLLFLLALSLTIAAPLIARSIQRDREVETMERGKQYARAIQLYFRKFGSYPPGIDALVKTNNIRFLRKRYIDPMTGKDDWKPILFGQNKAPLAMGFFGEPLAAGATAIAGVGPSGGNATPGAGLTGSSTGIGSPGGGSSTPGTGLLGSGSLFGSGQNTGTGATTGGTQTGTTGTGTSGTATSGTGTSTLGGQSGQTFGGAGIVGFAPAATKQSILTYKKKNRYNEWEFTYSPISDQMKQIGNTGTIGQPAGSLGGRPGSSGLPSNSGTGTTGTGSTTQPR